MSQILKTIWQMRNAYRDFHLPNTVTTREMWVVKRIIGDLEKILKKHNFTEPALKVESENETIKERLVNAYKKATLPTDEFPKRNALLAMDQCILLIDQGFDIDADYQACWDRREKS